MAQKASGKAYRKGISLREFLLRFLTDAVAGKWFVEERWPDAVCGLECGSLNVQTGRKHKTMPFRC